ncbi:MAG: winged helix-turn-helix transcriptional regulator [Erysipelotrichales bacterium]|nr:winged helix-turn-helix transcriptional regulator [Erysipelotrichales bacterium]
MDTRYDVFTTLISNIAKNLQKIKKMEMIEFGLKGNQVQCLFYLATNIEGVSSTKLCKLCNEDKGAMSRTLKELESKKLIFIEENDSKKYRNPICLTEEGKMVSSKIINKIDTMFNEISKNITLEQREIFYDVLNKIDFELENICNKYRSEHD